MRTRFFFFSLPYLCFLAVTLCVPYPLNAIAETELDLGAAVQVERSAYKEYTTQWSAFPIIALEHDWFYIRGTSAGVKVFTNKYLEFSAYAHYDATSFSSHKSTHSGLRKLNDRHSTLMAGSAARLTTPAGLFSLSMAADTLGTHKGYQGELAYANSIDFTWIEFNPTLGLRWQSSQYNDYYYGVSHKEAKKSQLDHYVAKNDISPYVGLATNINFTNEFAWFVHGSVTFLGKQMRNSPMVGRSHTESLSTGLSYEF